MASSVTWRGLISYHWTNSERLDDIPKNQPIIAVCQSGKRSAMATDILLKSDFEQVANLPGGMIQWSRLALPFHHH